MIHLTIYRIYQLLFLIRFSFMGNYRSTPDTVKHSTIKRGRGFTYAATHMCGWKIYMEDAHIDVPKLQFRKNSLFAVFDGHDGAEVSTYAKRHFTKELEANKNYQSHNYQLALKQTFLKIDEMLLSEEGKKQIVQIRKQMKDKDNGPKYEEASHAGCTANVVLITPRYIYCANAGDSRSVACIEGQTKQLSKDHKPEDPVELKRIKKAGGTVINGRVNGGLNLSRALGDHEYKDAKLKPQDQMISPNPDITRIYSDIDFIIMGSHGIWQVKTNNKMVTWISSRINKTSTNEAPQILKSTLEELLDSLVSKDSGNEYGMDNMSAILIKFDKENYKEQINDNQY